MGITFKRLQRQTPSKGARSTRNKCAREQSAPHALSFLGSRIRDRLHASKQELAEHPLIQEGRLTRAELRDVYRCAQGVIASCLRDKPHRAQGAKRFSGIAVGGVSVETDKAGHLAIRVEKLANGIKALKRTFHIIFDPSRGEYQLILNTKSKHTHLKGHIVRQVKHRVGKGAFKSGKTSFRIDTKTPIAMADMVVQYNPLKKSAINSIVQAQKAEGVLESIRKTNSPYIVLNQLGPIYKDKEGKQQRMAIFSEYSELGDLNAYLRQVQRSQQPLSEVDRYSIMHSLLSGLFTFHRNGVVHRDIKPANLLLFRNDEGFLYVKIADLDTCAEVDDPSAPYLGTFGYMSPELLARQEAPKSAHDLWAAAVTLCELFSINIKKINSLEIASNKIREAESVGKLTPEQAQLIIQLLESSKSPIDTEEEREDILQDIATGLENAKKKRASHADVTELHDAGAQSPHGDDHSELTWLTFDEKNSDTHETLQTFEEKQQNTQRTIQTNEEEKNAGFTQYLAADTIELNDQTETPNTVIPMSPRTVDSSVDSGEWEFDSSEDTVRERKEIDKNLLTKDLGAHTATGEHDVLIDQLQAFLSPEMTQSTELESKGFSKCSNSTYTAMSMSDSESINTTTAIPMQDHATCVSSDDEYLSECSTDTVSEISNEKMMAARIDAMVGEIISGVRPQKKSGINNQLLSGFQQLPSESHLLVLQRILDVSGKFSAQKALGAKVNFIYCLKLSGVKVLEDVLIKIMEQDGGELFSELFNQTLLNEKMELVFALTDDLYGAGMLNTIFDLCDELNRRKQYKDSQKILSRLLIKVDLDSLSSYKIQQQLEEIEQVIKIAERFSPRDSIARKLFGFFGGNEKIDRDVEEEFKADADVLAHFSCR